MIVDIWSHSKLYKNVFWGMITPRILVTFVFGYYKVKVNKISKTCCAVLIFHSINNMLLLQNFFLRWR